MYYTQKVLYTFHGKVKHRVVLKINLEALEGMTNKP